MKKLILISVILFSSYFIFAQESTLKQSLRFGVNVAFWGADDVLGNAIYGEYIIPVNKYFAIAPRIASGTTNNQRESAINDESFYDYKVANAFATSVSMKITPFPESFNRFSFDLGLLYHKWSEAQEDHGYDYNTGIVSYSRYYEEKSFGFIGVIDFNIYQNDKITDGFNATMHTGLFDTYLEALSIQGGFYFGVKL